uniref:autotransporter outer membrane beta-barrel domain-containing protein n=1 Tax=Ruegeria atlantica TaxID=81569 RepID=UPI00147FD1C6
WERTGGTGDGSVVLSRPDTATPSFTADVLQPGDDPVTHVFELVVFDDADDLSAVDSVTITVAPQQLVELDVEVSPSELTVQEGSGGQYRVRLSAAPEGRVVVVPRSNNADVSAGVERLVFSPENWNVWQSVSVSSVADSDDRDDVATFTHSLAGEGVQLGDAGEVIVTVREEDPILRPIGEFLSTRAQNLLNNQPELVRFLKNAGSSGSAGNRFNLTATEGNVALDGSFVRNGFWGEISATRASTTSLSSSYVLGSLGVHKRYSETFLAGVMLQFDRADTDLSEELGTIEGTGWLAGPYFVTRHRSHPLYLEGRLLYGQSDNDIRFRDAQLGERRGSFDTTRWLAQLRLEGEAELSDGGTRLIPYADARWIEDRAKGFTDSLEVHVPGQKVAIGQLELGSNIEIPIAVNQGTLTFTGGLGLVFTHTDGEYTNAFSRNRGRGELGFEYNVSDNVYIELDSFYDGIGTSGYEGYGLSFTAEIKF